MLQETRVFNKQTFLQVSTSNIEKEKFNKKYSCLRSRDFHGSDSVFFSDCSISGLTVGGTFAPAISGGMAAEPA